MRLLPAALVMAATLTLCGLAAASQTLAQSTPAAGATPQVEALGADPSHALDNDQPPPFVRRPKRAPEPPRPDMTYAKGPEPTEFRGLHFGLSLEQAKAQAGLVPVTQPKPLPGTFHRPDETLTLGSAPIRSVAYYFPKGRFVGAGVVFEGEVNFFLIKDHLISLYGPGRQIGGRYGWTWNSVNIDLRLNEGMGELRYTFEPPAQQSAPSTPATSAGQVQPAP